MTDAEIADAYNSAVGGENGAATELHGENGAGLKSVVPVTYEALTPHLMVQSPRAAEAIAFYKKAFGAEEIEKVYVPKRKAEQEERLILHAHVRFGQTNVFLADEPEHMTSTVKSPAALKGTSFILHVGTTDVDAAIARAVEAGATVEMPVADQFWGARYGSIVDPFGFAWGLSTPLPKGAKLPPNPAELAVEKQAS